MKKLKGLLFIFVSILALGCLASCGGKEKNESPSTNDKDEVVEETQQEKIYKLALSSGYTGTYEEWLNSIKGDSIELKVESGNIKWKYTKESNWINLISLTELAGAPGKDGVNGKEIELSTNATHIIWRYVGDSECKNLLSLEVLGCDCTNNDNTTSSGQSAYDIAVELGFVGTVEDWILSLKGEDGLSAYEIYKKYYPEYTGSEEDWINELASGSLASNEQKVTVTFKDGDTVLKTEKYFYGQAINEPSNPEKEGYVFKGWTYEGEKWNFKFYTVGRSIELQAKWVDDIFDITFIDKGNVYESYTCKYLDVISKPIDPVTKDYFFDGWYLDPSYEIEYDFSAPIRDDLKLYAKWREPYDLNVNYYCDNTLYATSTVKEGNTISEYCYPEGIDYIYYDVEFYNTPNSELQTEETLWNISEEIYEDVDLYCVAERKMYTYSIVCGEEQISELSYAEGDYSFKYKCFDFGQILGKTYKQGFDCIKTLNDTKITITETSKLSIIVRSGSSNSLKRYIALFKVTASDAEGNMTAGELMNPTNAEIAGFTVDSGKVNISNDALTTVEFDDLEAGTYILTAGGSNSLLNDGNGAGTNLIAEISLSNIKELYPIEYISLAEDYDYKFLIGREVDLSNLEIVAYHETGYKINHTLSELNIDLSMIDIDTLGVYNVDVYYTNPIDNKTYVLEGGIDVEIVGVDSLEFADYRLIKGYITKNLTTVFVNENITFDNLVVIGKTDNGDYVLSSNEYSVNVPTLVKGKNVISIISNGKVEALNIYYVDDIYPSDATEVMVNVNPSSEVIVNEAEGATFNTINQALDYLRACNLNDEVIKTINVAAGEYFEKVEIDIPNVILKGADSTNPDATVITYDALAGKMDSSNTMEHTLSGAATIAIRPEAVGFKAQDITFKNEYNTFIKYKSSLNISDNTQAPAALVEADQSVFINVKFTSYMDTLFASVGRQYYEDCYIEGGVDYILGYNATALFKDCKIHTLARYNSDFTVASNGGYVVASKGNKSYTDTDIEYGFIFDGCIFEADSDVLDGSIALGRVWGSNMRVMIMNSEISGAYSKEAYSGATYGERYLKLNSVPNPEYLLEYNNKGAGAVTLDDQEDLIDTCTIIDIEDADLATVLAKFTTENIFGAVNGKVKYDTPWNDPNVAKNASIKIVVVGMDSTVEIPYVNYGWIGSTVTNYQLNSEAEAVILEGYEIAAFYKDAECTTVYDDTTLLAENNTIYLKVYKIGEKIVANYLYSNETNEDWTWTGEAMVTLASNIGKTLNSLYVDDFDGESSYALALKPAVEATDITVASDATALSYNVGASKAVYLQIVTGCSGTSHSGTLTILGYDVKNNVVATATGKTPTYKYTNYVTANDGTTIITLKTEAAPITKVVIMNNDSTNLYKGVGVHSVELTYFELYTSTTTQTYTFDWSKINTTLLESTGTYNYDLEGNVLAEENQILKYDKATMSTQILLSGFDYYPNITVIGGLTYRDGLKYWNTSKSAVATNASCLELKGMPNGEVADNGTINDPAGISIVMSAPGKITFTASSTGQSNYSSIGLLDSNGNWISAETSATLITDGMSYAEEEYGAYEVYGISFVTFIFEITEAGTYTIAVPSVTNDRNTRIRNLIIQEIK